MKNKIRRMWIDAQVFMVRCAWGLLLTRDTYYENKNDIDKFDRYVTIRLTKYLLKKTK